MTWVLPLPRRSEYPSGFSRATAAVPIAPPAPPMFSTKTEPSGDAILSTQGRPIWSPDPPAA
jgi:hypothetical protein